MRRFKATFQIPTTLLGEIWSASATQPKVELLIHDFTTEDDLAKPLQDLAKQIASDAFVNAELLENSHPQDLLLRYKLQVQDAADLGEHRRINVTLDALDLKNGEEKRAFEIEIMRTVEGVKQISHGVVSVISFGATWTTPPDYRVQ